MNVEESIVMLPDEIYGFQGGLMMPVPQLQMALKSIEHFMGEFGGTSLLYYAHSFQKCPSTCRRRS